MKTQKVTYQSFAGERKRRKSVRGTSQTFLPRRKCEEKILGKVIYEENAEEILKRKKSSNILSRD